MSIWNPLITERTTAATDILLFVLAVYYCWRLYSRPVIDFKKRRYWVLMIAATGIAALLGAVDHGFNWSEQTRELIWQPLNLSLGFVIAFFVQGSIHEKWGVKVSDQFLPWAIFAAVAFYVFTLLSNGSFIVFIGYQGLGMLFSLVVFLGLYIRFRKRYLLYMIAGIVISIFAAVVQGTGSLNFTLIWPFDHNGSFHLIQAISSIFIFKSLTSSLFNDEKTDDFLSLANLKNQKSNNAIVESIDQQKIDNIPIIENIEESDKVDPSIQMGILSGLTKEQMKRLKKLSTKEKYSTGTPIINEGDSAKCFFVVQSGKVDVVKDGVTLGSKYQNEEFGSMAMIDGSKRSADVIAAESSVLRSIPFKKIQNPKNKDIYQKIISNQLKSQQNDLKRMNDVTISEVKQKLSESLKREDSAKFFISLVFVLVFYQFFLGVFLEYGDSLRERSFLEILTPILTIFLGAVSVGYAFKSKFDLTEYGFTWGDWKKEVPQALLWTFVFLAVLTTLKWIATFIPGPFYGQKVIDPSSLPEFDPWTLLAIYSIYVLLVPVQEIVARGVIQTSLMRVFQGNWSRWKAILLSNCMFSSFHLYLDMKFAILTFIPGLFWGYLFSEQKSLLGVSISHIIIGLFALTLLQNY